MSNKIDQPIYLEIFFEEEENVQENLEKIVNSSDFKSIVKTEIHPRLQQAIEKNKKEFALFRMVFYGVDLLVDKKYYKPLLGKVLSIYEEEEDYLKCAEIKKLIDIL